MSDRRNAAIVVATWLVARILCSLIFAPWAHFNEGDAAYYLDVARSIRQAGGHSFHGEPTLYRAPGYPAFLAMLPGLPGAAWAAQSLVMLAVALFTLRRIPGRLGLVTTLLIVSSPFFIAYEWALTAESLSIALTWSAWLILTTEKRRPVVAGLLIGLAAMMRETALLLSLFAAVLAFFVDPKLAKKFIMAAVVAYAVTVPWQLRNASLPNGHYALSDGRFGFNLWIGTWERNGNWYLAGLDKADYPPNAFRSQEERAQLMTAFRTGNDHQFLDVALDRWRDDPLGTMTTWVVRYPRLLLGTRTDQIELKPARGSTPWTALKAGFWGLNAFMMLGGLAGFLLAAWRRSGWIIFAVPIAYFAALYFPFHNVETRYSLPALPFFYFFAAYLVTQLVWRPTAKSPSEFQFPRYK